SHVDEGTLTQDTQMLASLLGQYHTILLSYITHDLLAQHSEQVAVLGQDNIQVIVNQQRTYAAGAWHTWSVYEGTERHMLQDLTTEQVRAGQTLARLQSEPEFADALSALRSLIQFNEQLASLVDGGPGNTDTQVVNTVLGTLLVFLAIALVGFLLFRSMII